MITLNLIPPSIATFSVAPPVQSVTEVPSAFPVVAPPSTTPGSVGIFKHFGLNNGAGIAASATFAAMNLVSSAAMAMERGFNPHNTLTSTEMPSGSETIAIISVMSMITAVLLWMGKVALTPPCTGISKKARLQVLEQLTKNISVGEDVRLAKLIQLTSGLDERDLRFLVKKAEFFARQREQSQ